MTSERPVLTFDYYRVKPGDNLSEIAKRYDSNVRRIARENNLNKSNFIVAGKKLKIPRGLYPEELEHYELAIEEQAYPFEEKAIKVHQSNLALITKGVYNEWIDKSLQKLAKLVPARYDKPEEASGIISSLETYIYEIDRPATPALAESKLAEPAQVEESGSVTKVEPAAPVQVEESGSVTKVEPATPVQVEESGSVTEAEPVAPEQVEESGSVTKVESEEAEQVKELGSVGASEHVESSQGGRREPPL
jgi:murein DD-endopeptidase MepM/ murein hydrolase activator NlpD